MKNTQITAKEQNQKIDEFIHLFQVGSDAWQKAGEIIVELVENDPHVYEYIIQKCPTLNAGILAKFEKLGRRILHPQLLLTSSPGYSKLSRLPYSLQERFIEEPIPLMVETPDGPDTLLVKARDLTADQAKQVFASDRIRTEGEQRAWMIDQRQKSTTPTIKAEAVYSIKNGKAVINGVEFTQRQLLNIAAELTK